eukprot:SAG31_NODE_2723_length_5187_cov_7.411164_4_plen_180_part_00
MQDRFVQIVSGYDHVALLTLSGRLFVLGSTARHGFSHPQAGGELAGPATWMAVRVVTFSFLCPLLEKYGTFIARCNALIEKVSSFRACETGWQSCGPHPRTRSRCPVVNAALLLLALRATPWCWQHQAQCTRAVRIPVGSLVLVTTNPSQAAYTEFHFRAPPLPFLPARTTGRAATRSF